MAGFFIRGGLLAIATGLAACASPVVKTTPLTPAAAVAPAEPSVPRLADGRPNFQGNWFKVGAYGGARGGGAVGGNPVAAGAAPVRQAAELQEPDAFYVHGVKVPYTPDALRERRWRAAHGTLDGEPLCQLAGTPRAHEQPPYPHLMIQDEKLIVILYEYVHEPRIIPLDGTPFRGDNYRTWMGDARAHWEGDTLVIETKGFNGRVWLTMSGDYADENLHVVERFTMKDGDTYSYQATVENPGILAAPLVFQFDHKRQPESDQLLSYDCLEGEDDLHHYTAADGGMAGVKLVKQPASVYGCLRAEPAANGEFIYTLTPLGGAQIKVTPAAALKPQLPDLVDREVKLDGKWTAKNARIAAVYADVHATGCRWDGR